MVSPEGTPLERRYFCTREDRELDWDEIVRGYEIEKDSFVVVTDDELERSPPTAPVTSTCASSCLPTISIPMHFERAYFLTPAGNSTKAYRLLAATMEKTSGPASPPSSCARKEYLVAILAENGILRAETLRFAATRCARQRMSACPRSAPGGRGRSRRRTSMPGRRSWTSPAAVE
jgi:DNA end-binding protein Ku